MRASDQQWPQAASKHPASQDRRHSCGSQIRPSAASRTDIQRRAQVKVSSAQPTDCCGMLLPAAPPPLPAVCMASPHVLYWRPRLLCNCPEMCRLALHLFLPGCSLQAFWKVVATLHSGSVNSGVSLQDTRRPPTHQQQRHGAPRWTELLGSRQRCHPVREQKWQRQRDAYSCVSPPRQAPEWFCRRRLADIRSAVSSPQQEDGRAWHERPAAELQRPAECSLLYGSGRR